MLRGTYAPLLDFSDPCGKCFSYLEMVSEGYYKVHGDKYKMMQYNPPRILSPNVERIHSLA